MSYTSSCIHGLDFLKMLGFINTLASFQPIDLEADFDITSAFSKTATSWSPNHLDNLDCFLYLSQACFFFHKDLSPLLEPPQLPTSTSIGWVSWVTSNSTILQGVSTFPWISSLGYSITIGLSQSIYLFTRDFKALAMVHNVLYPFALLSSRSSKYLWGFTHSPTSIVPTFTCKT